MKRPLDITEKNITRNRRLRALRRLHGLPAHARIRRQSFSATARKSERAAIVRAFAHLKENAPGWLAKLPDFVRQLTPRQLRLMADCLEQKSGAIEEWIRLFCDADGREREFPQ
jgi:hypothetical protein